MATHDQSICPCDDVVVNFEPEIAAALDALPRQTRTFSNVRQALLSGVHASQGSALSSWAARGERDLGVMWLEMWAYVADVLNFYDERIANESYLRTAQRRPSLRRLIELLGYIQAPGIAGSVSLGAIADGQAPVILPAGVGFRSDAFDDEAPQVFELDQPTEIEPQRNEWTVGPLDNNLLPQDTPTVAADPVGTGASPSSPGSPTRHFAFEAGSLGAGPDSILWFQWRTRNQVARLLSATPFEGKDGRSYVEVQLSRGLSFQNGTDPKEIRVRTPGNSAGVKSVDNPTAATQKTTIRLNAVIPSLRSGSRIAITSEQDESLLLFAQVIHASTTFVDDNGAPAGPPAPGQLTMPASQVTVFLGPNGLSGSAQAHMLHFDWTSAGKMTTVRSPLVRPSDITGGQRVPIEGVVPVPPSGSTVAGELLLRGAQDEGAHVRGSVEIDATRRGMFGVEQTLSVRGLPAFETQLSVFGNVLTASRGETVHREVLGSGDPRRTHQTFQLRKKPLTYLPAPGTPRGIASTLTITVDGVEWREVRTFFGCGPQDQVFTVRHDDEQETVVRFGDGRRGARLPAGEDNVVARYRFGAGAKAPPAGAVTQLARSVPGLRSVRSPVAARPGRDPDDEETLRTSAPRSLLLIGRAVSVADFQALAERVIGVVRASAEFRWLPERQVGGVHVSYIGDVNEANILSELIAMADPDLPVTVQRAQPRRRRLSLRLVVDGRFELSKILDAIPESLTAAHRVLSAERAVIGGRLWVSPIYEAVLEVPGVLAVEGASIVGQGKVLDLATRDFVSPGQNQYFDFLGPGAIEVTVSEATNEEVLEPVHRGES